MSPFASCYAMLKNGLNQESASTQGGIAFTDQKRCIGGTNILVLFYVYAIMIRENN